MMPVKLLLGLLLQIGAVSFGAAQGQMPADAPVNVRAIRPGEHIIQEIGGRKVDRYRMRLEAGQFAKFTAKELGVAVVVSVIGPSGATIAEVSLSNGTRGQESVSVIADQAGSYLFQVRALGPLAVHGHYQASITEPRAATDPDRATVLAQVALAKAQGSIRESASRGQPQKEQALAALAGCAEVARLAHEGGDHQLESFSLTLCGVANYFTGDLHAALERLEEALSIERSDADQAGEAETLMRTAFVYSKMKDEKKALDLYSQALVIYRALGDTQGETFCVLQMGMEYRSVDGFQKALDFYDQAISKYRSEGNRHAEAETLIEIAVVYGQMKDSDKAVEYYSQAIALLKATGDRARLDSALQSVTRNCLEMIDPVKEFECLNQVLPHLEGASSRSKALIFHRLAYLYSLRGESRKAEDYQEQSLALYRSAGDIDGQAGALLNFGLNRWSMGENQKAIDDLNEAVRLERVAGNRQLEGAFLTDLGMVYSSIGELQKALESYKAAAGILDSLGDYRGEEMALRWIQGIYARLGDYDSASRYSNHANTQRAIDQLSSKLAQMKAHGSKWGEAETLLSLASLYWLTDEKQRALNYALRAGLLLKEAGQRNREGTAHEITANYYAQLGQRSDAVEYYLKAIRVYEDGGLRWASTQALTSLAVIYQSFGDTVHALECYKQALDLYRERRSRTFETDTLMAIGRLHESTGEWQKALDSYREALDLSRAILNRAVEAELLHRISFVKQKLGDLSGALVSSEGAMSGIEAVRGSIAGHDARSYYLSTRQPIYDDNVQLLMRLDGLHPGEHYSSLALQTSERARARSLLEMLAESHADVRQGADPALLERERSLQRSLEAKSQLLEGMLNGAKPDSNADSTKNEILGLLSDYNGVEAKIRAKSPKYAALTQPHPLSVAEIQREVLDDDTALIEYHLTPSNSFMWFVTKDSVQGRQLGARETIEAASRRVYDLLASRNNREKFEEDDEKSSRIAKTDAEFAAASAALTKLILEPISDLLAGKERLFVVADGALQYIPFAALPDPGSANGDPLVVQHEIVSAPSASALALIRSDAVNRPVAQNQIAVLADPVFSDKDPRVKGTRAEGKATKSATPVPAGVTAKGSRTGVVLRSAVESGAAGRDGFMERLPYSRKEADAIASLVSKDNAMVAMDFNANKSTATDPRLGGFRYVHFATHSLLNSTHPELSGLVFSLVDANGSEQDGFLQAHEVYNLKLPVDMVVLSACNTGLGKEISGEGIVGITRGFMYAGASRVLVSQWRVADDATAELMARMYSGILGPKKLRPLAALREAQISMWKDKRWTFPYYWAGFVMQGEWR